jgi:hypothetical protein
MIAVRDAQIATLNSTIASLQAQLKARASSPKSDAGATATAPGDEVAAAELRELQSQLSSALAQVEKSNGRIEELTANASDEREARAAAEREAEKWRENASDKANQIAVLEKDVRAHTSTPLLSRCVRRC